LRHILNEYDGADGLDEIVEFVDNDGRTYRIVRDVAGFKPTVKYAKVKDDWKRVAVITDYGSFMSDLYKDDLRYPESIGE